MDTALMKPIKEYPVFFEGQIHTILLDHDFCELHLLLKSTHNPRFKKDTQVVIRCLQVHTFSFARRHYDSVLIKIHDFDVKRTDDGLHLRIEDREGLHHYVIFKALEMYEKTDR
jgi:hypothetical protein